MQPESRDQSKHPSLNLVYSEDIRLGFDFTNLGYQILCYSLGKTSLFAGKYHLKHITFQFLHHYKDTFGSLEHALQVDNTCEYNTM